ncbi:MAG TPA: tetraacyldisaccharide 4'-kinase [Methylophilaceae bacterium]|nr:tetraacyldisaccharide 4'-kinase [Methylophilaceae bacterium]
MNAWLQKQWYSLTFWHFILIPLSWIFLSLSSLRCLAYKAGLFKSWEIAVPVIVVGNISVGGTGKTPLVIWLAEQLTKAGWQPGIISRGYGAVQSQATTAVFRHSKPALVGDEPLLLVRRTGCPVWVGPDRVAVAQALLNEHPRCNIIISDDGLQHYRMHRDFEMAVIDASRGFGNGWVLPAGPLRERLTRLASVDAVVSNGDGAYQQGLTMSLESSVFHNVLDPTRTASTQQLMQKKLHAIAGIGNPARFFQQLSNMGLQFEPHAFADHHAFQASDLQSLQAEAILMTEKDAVKCADFAQPDWWYLPVEAKVDEALLQAIQQKIGNSPASKL